MVGKNNIWSTLAKHHEGSPTSALDWEEMEGLFCQQPATIGSPSPTRSTKENTDSLDRRRKEPTEV